MRRLALAVLALPLAAYTYFLNDAFTAALTGAIGNPMGQSAEGRPMDCFPPRPMAGL